MKIQSVVVTAIMIGGMIAAPAFTQAATANSQQTKMKACNQQAAGKTGDARKAFMKQCLSASSAAPAPQKTQQQRMKDCNQQATGKTGADRKAFMKQCLSTK